MTCGSNVSTNAILTVEGLRTEFVTPSRVVRAVDGVSFSLTEGERLALIGESGSGKSVTALSIMRLIRDPGKIVGGKITLLGEDLLAKSNAEMEHIRGHRASMIFQDPASYLDPMFTAGHAISETIRLHENVSRADARRRAIRLLCELKVPSPEDIVDAYPFQLSGGMCQRVLIATAVASRPNILIADEATSNLDVTVQANILRTLRALAEESGTAILITTHNMQVARKACSRIIVMYCGRIMEAGPTDEVLDRPLHPYTARLLEAMPSLQRRGKPLVSVRAAPPLGELQGGCIFRARCPIAKPVCAELQPPLVERAPGRASACPYLEADHAA